MRDYLLLAIVVGLVPLILYRAWFGALAWTWIGLMNPHRFTWDLYEFPFAQVIGLTLLVGWLITRDKKAIPLSPGIVFTCLLLLFVTVKNPFAWNQEAAWDKWSQYFKIVAGALLVSTLIYSPRRVRWYLWIILFSIGVVYGVKGGLFSIATGGQFRVHGPPDSFIADNTTVGVALVMVAPMFVAFMRDAESPWLRLAAACSLWLSLIASLFTYSRGVWLGLVVVCGLLFLQSKRKALLLVILTAVGVFGVGLIPEKVFDRAETISEYKEDLSAMQRIQGWGVAINVAVNHPLGAGFVLERTPVDRWMSYANFEHPAFNRSNAAHSIYFQMLGDHGFGGLALFLIVIVLTFRTLSGVRASARGDPACAWMGNYATALMIGLAGYCVSGAFVSLAYFDLFYTFVVLAGILQREVRAAAITRSGDEVREARPLVSSREANGAYP